MTLNVNEPTDQRTVSELPSYIRENRAEINSFTLGSDNIAQTTLAIAAAVVSLTVGTDIADAGLETIVISGSGAGATLATILGGTDGQIKIFIFQDALVSLLDGVKNNGKFYLNHTPVLSNFAAQQNDILALRNIGGDGASNHGYWKELYRTLANK